jgi:hypothetical protein
MEELFDELTQSFELRAFQILLNKEGTLGVGAIFRKKYSFRFELLFVLKLIF